MTRRKVILKFKKIFLLMINWINISKNINKVMIWQIKNIFQKNKIQIILDSNNRNKLKILMKKINFLINQIKYKNY